MSESSPASRLKAVTVIGVRMELPSNQPIVLLQEEESNRFLPIWIGAVEAAAIANVQQGIVTARPLTHDLVRDIFLATGIELLRVEIIDLQDRIYFADLVFDDGTRVSARPSDAIAIALRLQAEILVADTVLDEGGIELNETDDDEDGSDAAGLGEIFDETEPGNRGSSAPIAESEVERFREFLDTISPDDFGAS